MTAQAKRGYEGYVASLGLKLPPWEELLPRVQEAWRAAAVAIIDEPVDRKESLTDKQVRLLQEMGTAAVARKLKAMLPPDQGFILFTVTFGKESVIAYVSTIDRDDVVRTLRAWLDSQGAL